MKNQIVLNLSGVSGKARVFIAAQVKNNLRNLGFNVDNSADADNSHLGFSLNANGDKLEVNFDFNNENQATRHVFSGAQVYNEHQLTEFFAAAKELAQSVRSTGTRATEEKGDAQEAARRLAGAGVGDRVVEGETDGIKYAVCRHGAGMLLNPDVAIRLLLEPGLFARVTKAQRDLAQKEGLLPAGA
jgi:hypothetical protein